MIQFFDTSGNKVFLSYKQGSFSLQASHVLVICQYHGNWLLTRHAIRGLEFPGGKIEAGETEEAAAKREVYEETGGIIQSLEKIGEFYVEDKKNGPFVKAIFYAIIKSLDQKENYLETKGPVVKTGNLLDELNQTTYSFIMKDQVVPTSLAMIEEKKRRSMVRK